MSIYMFARYNSTQLPTHTHSCVCKCELKAKTPNKTPPTHTYTHTPTYIYIYICMYIIYLCVCVCICKCIHHMVFCSFLGVGSMMTQIKENKIKLCVHPIIKKRLFVYLFCLVSWRSCKPQHPLSVPLNMVWNLMGRLD